MRDMDIVRLWHERLDWLRGVSEEGKRKEAVPPNGGAASFRGGGVKIQFSPNCLFPVYEIDLKNEYGIAGDTAGTAGAITQLGGDKESPFSAFLE